MYRKKLRRWSFYVTGLVLLIALLTLSGWYFDIAFLRRPIPRLVAMNPMSAVALCLCSITFYLTFANIRKGRHLGTLLSLLVFLVGFIKIISLLFDYPELQIDRILFTSYLQDDFNKTALSLMSLNTAVNLVLAGLALYFGRRNHSVSQSLSALIFFLTWIPVLGYLYHVPEFYGLLPHFPMAVQTAACFLLFSIALLFVDPHEGWIKEFVNDEEGSLLIRLLIPFAIIIPVVLGYIRLLGHWAGMFSTEFGVAILTSTIIMVFVAGIGYCVRLLNKRDRLRKSMVQKLGELSVKLQENNEEVSALNEELRSSNEEYHSVNEQLVAMNAQLDEANKTIAAQKDEQLNRVLEFTPTIVWSFDLTGKGQDYMSRSIHRIVGMSSEEFLNVKETWSNYVYPADLELWNTFQQRLNQFGHSEETCRFVDWQGQRHWMQLKYWIIKNENGTPLRQDGIAIDITAAKEAEKKLAKERLLLRSLIDNIPDYIFVKDNEFRHIINNKANVELLGAVSEEDTLGKSAYDYFGAAGNSFFKDDQEILNTGIPILNKEETLSNAKGELIRILTTKVPLKDEEGNAIGIVGISRDITEYKKQEKILNQYKENLDIVFNNTKEQLLLLDEEGRIVLLNRSLREFMEKATGKKLETGKYLWDITIPSRRETSKAIFNRALLGESIVLTIPIPLVEGDVILESRYEPVVLEGRIKFIIIVSSDITENKKQESIIRSNEANLKTIFEHTEDAFILLDQDYKIVLSNNPSQNASSQFEVGAHFFDFITADRKEVFRNYLERAAKGETIKYNIKYGSDESSIWYDIVIDAVHVNEQLTGFCITTHDITTQRQSQEKINQLNHSLSDFQNAIYSSSIVSRADRAGNITFVNSNFIKISGYSETELIGKNHHIINSGFHPKSFWVAMWKTISSGNVWRQDVKNKAKDGSYYWVDTFIIPFLDEDGKVIEFLSIRNDITIRKNAELEIEQKQALLEQAYGIANIGHWVRELSTGDVLLSQGLYTIYGVSEDDFKKDPDLITRLIHADDSEKVRVAFKNSLRDKTPFEMEHRIIRSDGSLRWVHHKAEVKRIGDLEKLTGITQDITERKKSEQILTEYNERYEILSRATNDAIWDWDIENDHETWNHGIETIFGYDSRKTEFSKLWWTEKIHPDDYRRVHEEIDAAFFKRNANWTSQYRYLCANGSYKYVLDRAYIIYHNDKPVRMIGAMQDVTEQKNFEHKITAIAQELSSLIENANTPIFGTDRNGYVNEWNKVTTQLTGYSKNEVLGKKLVGFIAEAHRDDFKLTLNQVGVNIPVSNLQIPMRTKDDRDLIILFNATPRKNSSEQLIGVLMVGQDITELIEYRQNLETKVYERTCELNEALQKERELVEMKSKFVSIASHEFRTPLSTIALVSGFLRKHREKLNNDEFNSKLNSIEKQVNHMTYLLDDILLIGKTEAGKIQTQFAMINIEHFFRQTAKEIEDNSKTHAIEIELTCTVNEFSADEKLLRNIVINLLTNAIKFSPESNVVSLRISNSQKYLIIEIEDHGIGITDEDLHNMFTSFYRGNNVGTIPGTGLGLSIVKKAVDLLRGDIKIKSKAGSGTTFTVTFPI